MYFAGHILKTSERESSEGDTSGDTVAKTGQKVLRSDPPTFKLPAGSTLVSFKTVVYVGQRFTRAPRWAPNDPAGNLKLETGNLVKNVCVRKNLHSVFSIPPPLSL